MALKLQSFKFVVVNHQFIYPKGTKSEDKFKLDPEYVKLSGIAYSGDEYQVCYLLDSFKEFGISKDQFIDYLGDCNLVIIGTGILKLDNSYNYRLDLESYNLNSYVWKLDISTKGHIKKD